MKNDKTAKTQGPTDPTSVSSKYHNHKDYDHLIDPANRMLGMTLKIIGKGMKGLFLLAIRLPRLFVRATAKSVQTSKRSGTTNKRSGTHH